MGSEMCIRDRAGQAVRMGKEMPAAELTRALAGAALARMGALSQA